MSGTSAPPLKLLIDTNIAVDVMLWRTPWAIPAARLLDAIARGDAQGWMAAHAITTAYYIVERELSRSAANAAIADLLRTLPVVPVGGAELQRAFNVGISDYEDAVHAVAALVIGADFIVTRNARDFRAGPVPPRSAADVLALL